MLTLSLCLPRLCWFGEGELCLRSFPLASRFLCLFRPDLEEAMSRPVKLRYFLTFKSNRCKSGQASSKLSREALLSHTWVGLNGMN